MESRKAYNKKYYDANKDRLQAYARDYNQKHKACPKFKKQAWARGIKSRFGITPEDYDIMYAEQQGCCLICNRHQSELPTKLAVDHDHKTGNIRGLLCRGCNTRLGWYEKFKKEIINYL